jgi:hypothetical protein
VVAPTWALGGEADILTPAGDGPRCDDTAGMARVTRGDYVDALAAAVQAGDLPTDYLEAAQQKASWQRFLAYGGGDHGPHPCHCSTACLAKHPKAPPRTSADL